MSKSTKEFELIIERLQDIGKFPNLYADPAATLIIIKILFNYCVEQLDDTVSIEQSNTIYNNTYKETIGSNLPAQYSIWKNNSSTCFYVIEIYTDIWNELHKELLSSQFHKNLTQKVNVLLKDLTFFINPDVTVMVYRNLIGFCLDDDGYQEFLSKYASKSKKEHAGDTSRGLLGLGEFTKSPPIFSQWDNIYLRISEHVILLLGTLKMI